MEEQLAYDSKMRELKAWESSVKGECSMCFNDQ